ncbi:unnamed protein product [Sphenostylis stenocarpa]|uniref:Uncharacterized protein n=1 Tax=Sphenostylis stenocarpa TaxID=92480 RepID=A0AA86S5G1_9FABA|nr:unnamed protein product [Sphenostylis stenocarpa]
MQLKHKSMLVLLPHAFQKPKVLTSIFYDQHRERDPPSKLPRQERNMDDKKDSVLTYEEKRIACGICFNWGLSMEFGGRDSRVYKELAMTVRLGKGKLQLSLAREARGPLVRTSHHAS